MLAAVITHPARSKADSLTAFGRPIHRISVHQFHQMMDAGVFSHGEKCELIRGVILEKAVPKPPHAYVVDVLNDLLRAAVGSGYVVRAQQLVSFADSEPEPDLAIAIGTRQDFRTRHPEPDEIECIIEVADTTLRGDRTTKLELYAEAGIACYWLVNLTSACVELHTHPRPGKKSSYRKKAVFGRGDSVPVILGGKKVASIPADDFLP